MPFKALVAEDDKMLAETLCEWLSGADYHFDVCHRGDEALKWLREYQFDVAIIDWNMPGLAGVEVIKQYRAAGGNCAILMLTANDRVAEKEQGLDAGADDYVTKPFDFKELAARLRALLRRPAALVHQQVCRGSLTLDCQEKTLKLGTNNVPLTPTEFAILQFFMRHPSEVLNNEALVLRIWGTDGDVTHDAIYSSIKRLRKKLGTSIIENIHGVGYKLGAADEQV